MRKIFLLCLCLLPGCTFVSRDLLDGIDYREHPEIEIIKYQSFFDLQVDCFKQHGVPGLYGGCAWIPYDPANKCVVRVMEGDETSLKHELQHCHGYADTWFPWMARLGV